MRSILTAVVIAGLSVLPAAAQPPSPTDNPVSSSLRSAWNGAKRNIQQSAEIMEEANYSFRPVDSVRTFGEILAHVAGANYVFCSAAKGEASPHPEDEFEKSAKTKAAIVKALNDSVAYCDAVFNGATDATLGQMVRPPFGQGQVPRANPLIGNVGHLNEHYGNLVTYFRINGIVPPSSRR
jgi:uncharacterized damage-inducible protein DinB